jgi:hypothetical protein
MIRIFSLRSLAVCSLAVCIPVCQAQQVTEPLSTHAQKVQTKIDGVSAGAPLTVILQDKTEFHGNLLSSDHAGFALDEIDLKKQIHVRYEDVKKLRNGYGGMNHATGRHVDPVRSKVIVIAVVGGVIAVLIAALATDK